MDAPATPELEVRLAALRVGGWLGWASVVAVLTALALGLPAQHRAVLVALVLAAAIANTLVVAVPRAWWATTRRGDRMLDVWSGGLLVFTATLVLVGGGRADLDLLLFLVLPFLATVHSGGRRAAWIAAGLCSFAVVAVVAPDPLPAGALALRGCVLVAATGLALVLAEITRRHASARAELAARAELEHALLAETHHRVKNSLQTVADLLLLGRPEGAPGRVFDETAERIRAIAIVHRLLAEERGAQVDAAVLLELIARGLAPDARLDVPAVWVDPTRAQHLGVVANELIANAVEHGDGPIDVALLGTGRMTLLVHDRGAGPGASAPGLGLQLVERVVVHGLDGTFALEHDDGGTSARVSFTLETPCAS